MRARILAQWTLAVLAIAGIVAAVTALAGADADFHVAALRIRISNPLRPLAIAMCAVAVLAVVSQTSRSWRFMVGVLLSAICVLILPILIRGAAPVWPVGDSAMTELYTLHATHGRQLLGVYSQYGWHHPGPMMFYAMAPLYVLGGRATPALWAAAFAVNVLAVAIAAWFVSRHRDSRLAVSASVSVFLIVYLTRLQGITTSTWSPHLALLPFVAFLLASSAVVGGDGRWLPLVALSGSFVVQAHLAFAPTVLFVAAACVVRMIFSAVLLPRQTGRVAVTTVIVLELAWLLPMAEELTGTPGNMTRLWRFFNTAGEVQPWAHAWRIWSGAVAGIADPDLHAAIGWGLNPSPFWLCILGTTLVALAAASPFIARSTDRQFFAAHAAVFVMAAGAALWSVRHVRGPIHDNHVSWMSSLGVMCAAFALAAVASRAMPAGAPGRWHAWMNVMAPSGLLLLVLFSGIRNVTNVLAFDSQVPEQQAVHALTEQVLGALPASENHRPLVRVDSEVWRVAAGVVLQMKKRSVPVTSDELADFFGAGSMTSNGTEDVALYISGADRHRQIAASSQARAVAEYRGQWYADVIAIPNRSMGLPP